VVGFDGLGFARFVAQAHPPDAPRTGWTLRRLE